MKAIFLKILERMKEPSTYAGLAVVMGGAYVFGLDPTGWEAVFAALASVAGVVAMLVKEKGPTPPETEK